MLDPNEDLDEYFKKQEILKRERERVSMPGMAKVIEEQKQERATEYFVLGVIAASEHKEEVHTWNEFDNILEKLVREGCVKKENGVYKLKMSIEELIRKAGW